MQGIAHFVEAARGEDLCGLFGQVHDLLFNSGADNRLRMHPAESESLPCTRPTVYAYLCSSAALTQLRFLITFGDVPLAVVTCTNEALYVATRKSNSSAASPPLVEPRCPSAHAQWNLREGGQIPLSGILTRCAAAPP